MECGASAPPLRLQPSHKNNHPPPNSTHTQSNSLHADPRSPPNPLSPPRRPLLASPFTRPKSNPLPPIHPYPNLFRRPHRRHRLRPKTPARPPRPPHRLSPRRPSPLLENLVYLRGIQIQHVLHSPPRQTPR